MKHGSCSQYRMQTTHHRLSQSSGLSRPAAGCRQRIRAVSCRCETANGTKKVVVLGGTGRVGSATAASLIANFKHYDITVASRSKKSFDNIMEIRPGLKGARFAQCDIGDKESVKVWSSSMTKQQQCLHASFRTVACSCFPPLGTQPVF